MKIGFIGTGSMGSILIDAFIHSGALLPTDMVISNRTIDKAKQLADKHTGLEVAKSNIEVMLKCDLIFLCVKPKEYKNVIDEIRTISLDSQIIVSITSAVLIEHLEEWLPCKIAKVIPSITNYVRSGATLCMYSERMLEEDVRVIEDLLAYISKPLRVDEAYTRICSDISSCGPAFMAFFLQKFIDAAILKTGISRELATELASEMLYGTGMLLTSGGMDPTTLQQKVSVPGGITAEGLSMMENELDGMFIELVHTTHAKYEEELAKVKSLF
ncbi:late competence protein ComER [Paenibacillus albiflavus]|uniref:Pyrroline-5-carboxylate reductase n=1 Tax=Paenibacillus albiflavus TaxID=2545760 RepID=A0A4R4EBJ0_9BACL|nr:late competence protein ComER [Paenibacillus albiflavus]TCZ77256.1 late competence protein ComER [Paenibacillus albiflavus]